MEKFNSLSGSLIRLDMDVSTIANLANSFSYFQNRKSCGPPNSASAWPITRTKWKVLPHQTKCHRDHARSPQTAQQTTLRSFPQIPSEPPTTDLMISTDLKRSRIVYNSWMGMFNGNELDDIYGQPRDCKKYAFSTSWRFACDSTNLAKKNSNFVQISYKLFLCRNFF